MRLRTGEWAGAVGVHGGGRGQETAGVRVLRVGEEGLGGALFDDAAVLHDGYAVGNLGDDGQVVRDEEHGQVMDAAYLFEEIEDLSLDRDVESGGGFVRDEELRAVDEGHGDEDALALTAGELVGVVVDAALGLRQGDVVHGL